MPRKAKQDFSFDDHWAETIHRKQHDGKEYVYAYVRRKHSYEDVNMEGEGIWVGLVEKPIYKMKLDDDPESDTHGQRVIDYNVIEHQDGRVDKIPQIQKMIFGYTYEATSKNLELFKKLAGSTIQGTTQLVWDIVGGKSINCPFDEDFWVKTVGDVQRARLKTKSLFTDETKSS